VDRAAERLGKSAADGLHLRRQALARDAARLEGLSPLAVLSRGYAVAFGPGDRILRRAQDVGPGDVIRVQLHEGAVEATVKGERP
jgi:exodeoxyribonuclease VII large subunit